MLKRIFSVVLFILLVTSILTLAFRVQPVRAQGTIYVRSDGSIDPSDAPISTLDNVTYTFAGDINNSIVIERDNIVVDGIGHTLQGTNASDSIGIDVSGRSNVTIENTNITNCWYGIYLNSSSNYNSITGNNIIASIMANNEFGIYLYVSRLNSISGNNISDNNFGIYLDSSSNNSISGNNITANISVGIYIVYNLVYYSGNIISGNNITNNADGIVFHASSNNSISGNNITDNSNVGIYLDSSSNNSISGNGFINGGLFVGDSYQNIVENNTVNGRPLVYLEEVSNYTVDDAGQVILVRCDNIRVEGLNLSRTNVGVILWETNNSNISENDLTVSTLVGIYLYNSSSNIISGNTITATHSSGIELDSSSGNIISGNNLTANNYDGISLGSCSGNIISGNNLTANNGHGIILGGCSNCSISGNTITATFYGGIMLGGCLDCSISGNNITDGSDEVIVLSSSSNNIIFGNNITNNHGSGIFLDSSSSYNSVSGNDITDNGNGIVLRFSSSYNTISGNNITNNWRGLIAWSSSSYNTISGNNITNNGYGINIESSSNNSIFHNNFVNNAYLYSNDSVNVWDDGYPSGGNYWSDYATRYPNATEIDNSGLWDTPYVIDANNTDNYPLMNPYESITYSLTITATAGGITNPPLGNYTYSQGQIVPVQAVPDIGYVFDNWELDGVNVGSANPYSAFMDSDHTLFAIFVPTYTLTITPSDNGTTNPAPGSYVYNEGTNVLVTAIPDTYYVLDHWEANGTSIGSNNPVTITMDADYTLNAVFTYNGPYSVTIEAYCNAEQTYVGVTIWMDGSLTSYITPHTFANLSGTHTFAVPATDAAGHPFLVWNTANYATTITVSTGGAYTAYYQPISSPVSGGPTPSVGGFIIPVDKLGLLAPYIGLASTITIASVASVIYLKRRKKKQ